MIFVITGMDSQPFDRLVRAVDELQASGTAGDDFFVQLGSCTYAPAQARYERFLPFDEVVERIRASSVVVTHAGAGSTLVCVQQGKHPVLVPRLARYGEAVDDHQLPFTAKLCEAGLATVVHDLQQLPQAIAEAHARTAPSDAIGSAVELTDWLERFWQAL